MCWLIWPAEGIIQPKSHERELKEAEVKLSVCMACHCAIQTIDHLSEIVKKHRSGSKLENLRLHRTKCSKIITEVVAPAIKDEIFKELQQPDTCYSLIVDESTDVASQKHLCICVIYFSISKNNVTTALLGLVPVTSTTGEALFVSIQGFLEQHSCPLGPWLIA